jgi:gluconate 2-dehydrogenase subunit 3-like protein
MRDGDAGRYPGYDVLAKWNTPSWNDKARAVIAARLSVANEPRFFTVEEWATLNAVCARIVPQPSDRPPIPVAALVDNRLHANAGDGYRFAGLPRMRQAWRRGLRALDEEARQAYAAAFHMLETWAQDALLQRAHKGDLHHPSWGGMAPALFFRARLLRDVVQAYYSHPTAWSEIGFGGPASPRGYVRMGFDRRDPWEAAEVKGGNVERVRRINERVG